MPTIVFASPKGGVGKSTAAVLLASELASHGGTVTMVDADPNRPLSQWASRPGKPERLSVVDSATEDSIIDTIETAALRTTFVIVDLEGTASIMAGYAMSRADLVIIPAQGSHLDATEAVKAIKLVKSQEKAFQRKIPFAILFTRTRVTGSRTPSGWNDRRNDVVLGNRIGPAVLCPKRRESFVGLARRPINRDAVCDPVHLVFFFRGSLHY
jgi:cellulose biosynthesis protein BcsQ